MTALTALVGLHESDPHEWPREELWSLWEELHWRWWEETHQAYRGILKEMGVDTVTCADLKLYALAPAADGQARFRFPNTCVPVRQTPLALLALDLANLQRLVPQIHPTGQHRPLAQSCLHARLQGGVREERSP